MGNDAMALRVTEPRKILKTAVENETVAVISYLSRDKWHSAKVLLREISDEALSVDICPGKKPHPINIQVGESVGLSLKHEYGKLLFSGTIVALNPSPQPTGTGRITISVPEENIELIQRRSYFRVQLPRSLKADVRICHRRGGSPAGGHAGDAEAQRASVLLGTVHLGRGLVVEGTLPLQSL